MTFLRARREPRPPQGLMAFALCVAVAAPWTSLASAQSAQVPDAAAVRAMLSGFEDGPSRADWRALGEGVLPALAQVAGDRSSESFLRERAVSAAASFSTPAARAILTRALRDPQAMVVRAAILGLADAFGESALSSVTPFLTSTDTALREAAIRALAAIDSSASTRALVRARVRETDVVLREQIDAALQARGARAG